MQKRAFLTTVSVALSLYGACLEPGRLQVFLVILILQNFGDIIVAGVDFHAGLILPSRPYTLPAPFVAQEIIIIKGHEH